MKNMKERIVRIAKANGTVLIRGESGVGKETGRESHPSCWQQSNFADAECELRRNSFGADGKPTLRTCKGLIYWRRQRPCGLFKQADGGTLFLDEVGELNLGGQAKLLRILEGHPFLPVVELKKCGLTFVSLLQLTVTCETSFVRNASAKIFIIA